MAKLFRACVGVGLLLAAGCAVTGLAHAQDLAPGPSAMQELSPRPADPTADLLSQYKNDPMMLHALREQARLRGEERQKQIVDATNLLLQLAQDLRTEIASPSLGESNTEKVRLEQIQKLAHLIQNREKTEDNVSSDLAKAGVW